jgi:hypothetical protein
MDRYNLRTTSLNSTQLATELTKRGAQTFGTVQRKQQRLQRFIDANAAHPDAARDAVRAVILAGTGRQGRTAPTLRRSSRIQAMNSQ